MKYKTVSTIAAILCGGLLAFGATTSCAQEVASAQSEQKDAAGAVDSQADLLTGRFTGIDFYGRVLDQDGKPAPNVTVTVLLDTVSPDPATFFSARKDIQVKTDEQGFFEYHGFGEQIFVSVHSQEGYERTTGLNPSNFQYGGMPGTVFTKHIPDKNKPVVFRVRKMEEAVPLISKYYSNDRFPFSRVFQVTGYFDMFQESTTCEYYAHSSAQKSFNFIDVFRISLYIIYVSWTLRVGQLPLMKAILFS